MRSWNVFKLFALLAVARQRAASTGRIYRIIHKILISGVPRWLGKLLNFSPCNAPDSSLGEGRASASVRGAFRFESTFSRAVSARFPPTSVTAGRKRRFVRLTIRFESLRSITTDRVPFFASLEPSSRDFSPTRNLRLLLEARDVRRVRLFPRVPRCELRVPFAARSF